MAKNKWYKEAQDLVKVVEDLDLDVKREFLDVQIASFEKQMYRLWIDVQIGQKYVTHGEKINTDDYITTGESKIQESVQQMRACALTIEKLRQLRAEIGD